MTVTEKSSFETIRSDHLPEPFAFLSSSTRMERFSLLRTNGETMVIFALPLLLRLGGQGQPLGLEDVLGRPGGRLGPLARRPVDQLVERVAQRVPEVAAVVRDAGGRDDRGRVHVLAVRAAARADDVDVTVRLDCRDGLVGVLERDLGP